MNKRTLKRLGLWLGVIGFFGFGIWGVIALVPEPPETVEGSNLPIIREQDHFLGPKDASLVLVEYGDFQCPACKFYLPMLKQLKDEFSEQMKFIYRHYPLRSIHQQAEIAARAAEGAALQGKFWEMHDMLFENQSEWAKKGNAKDIFVEYAEELELDIEQFKRDSDSSFVKDKVQTDFSGGNVAGVPGTPTFFLQGKRIVNPQSYEVFQALILEAFKSL